MDNIEQYKERCKKYGVYVFKPGEKVLINKRFFEPGSFGHREAVGRTIFTFIDYTASPAYCKIEDSSGFCFQTCPHEIMPISWADNGVNRYYAG